MRTRDARLWKWRRGGFNLSHRSSKRWMSQLRNKPDFVVGNSAHCTVSIGLTARSRRTTKRKESVPRR